MRTKTLLLTAAVAAAGFAYSSMAQVYSVNVVGYVSVVTSNNTYVLLANPLNDGTNSLGSLLGTMPNKSIAQLWDGTTFVASTKGGSPSVWSPDLSVPVGTGFFLKTPSQQTNTFVGSVIVGPGQSVTNALPTTYALVGSPIPFSDTLNGATLGLGVLPNKSIIQAWNGSTYVASTKGGSPSVWSPDLPVVPAQGFFVQSKAATNWVQTLP
ncbi:MAG: hypothetical protein HY298_00815 [Verrucomicrobia bacterium]|nr:hypothetical protein [Verrucomicrobiota bacterium]